MLEGLRQRLHAVRETAAGPRALLAALTAWLPLLLLASDRAPLHHVASTVRFLVAVPLLVLADRLLGSRMREAAEQFLTAGLVAPDERDRGARAQASLARFETALAPAVVCLGLAYLLSNSSGSASLPPWARVAPDGDAPLSAAGWWLRLVALPVFWYQLLRRLASFLAWAVFLFRIARLRLELLAAHPDRIGGLGFLAQVQGEFGVVLFAVGLAVSTTWWQGVAEGRMPASAHFQTAVGYVVGATLFAALPLMVFVPRLRQLKWRSELEYGQLASRYIHAFARRWIRPAAPADDEALLGTPDLQSLADLVNSVTAVRALQRIPLTREAATRLVAFSGLSMLPLALAAAPLAAILQALLKALL